MNLLIFFVIVTSLISKELPKELTEDEKLRIHEIPLMSRQTDPPVGPLRNIAEYERMQGVLVRYPFGISLDIISEIAEDIKIYCLVSEDQQNLAQDALENGLINNENIEFIIGNTDSYWTRDYGPWWVINGENKMSVVDFTYNRPRPNDNEAPFKLSEHFEVPFYASDIIHAGGNYMTDGYGIAASSDLVFEENTISENEIMELMNSYYGINEYHVIDDPNNTYIDHIDCWGKYLSPEKVLIREVPNNHPQYNQIEETVSYFLNTTNSWDEPWKIYRVWTPGNEPYTNSLIINDKVLVPIIGSNWDDDALNSYRDALPGYQVFGYPGTWESTDALHCRTKGIPDLEMLQISHNPINDWIEPSEQGYQVVMEVFDLSNSGLVSDSMTVFWKKSVDNNWQERRLFQSSTEADLIWSGFIPLNADSTEIQYYLQAADSSGRVEKNPIGGWHVFSALPTNICNNWLMGDLNSSGKIDVTDILSLSENIFFGIATGICSDSVSDINDDGEVSLLDVVLLVNILLNQRDN
jgi:agmatine/peptidylarginine deiminase